MQVFYIDILVIVKLGVEQVTPVVMILVTNIEVRFLSYECGGAVGPVAEKDRKLKDRGKRCGGGRGYNRRKQQSSLLATCVCSGGCGALVWTL